MALRTGVPCEVSLEARMGCSLGACMGCVIRGWDDAREEQFLRVCLRKNRVLYCIYFLKFYFCRFRVL